MTRILTRTGLLAALLMPGLAAAAGLNDTGITRCANLNENNLDCPQEPFFPHQDADIGRDAQATASPPTLSKAGGGSAGFDFTKVCNSGELAGQGSCPAEPLPGSDLDDWGCTRDNVTGRIWEIKTADGGLRDKDWRYTWCNTNASTNGGSAGTCDGGLGVDSDKCFDKVRCDTEKYVEDVNALNPPLCGYTDWRMPTVGELSGIVDHSIYSPDAQPTIDTAYFPNTVRDNFWSASPYASRADVAWYVLFSNGDDYAIIKAYSYAVRLVRGGQ